MAYRARGLGDQALPVNPNATACPPNYTFEDNGSCWCRSSELALKMGQLPQSEWRAWLIQQGCLQNGLPAGSTLPFVPRYAASNPREKANYFTIPREEINIPLVLNDAGSGFPWLPILAAGVGAYFLFRGKR